MKYRDTYTNEIKTIADAKAQYEEDKWMCAVEMTFEEWFANMVKGGFFEEINEMDKDRIEEMLAGELYEMVALGWTDEEARENEDAFFERIGDYADGLTKEEVWQVWENVIENA